MVGDTAAADLSLERLVSDVGAVNAWSILWGVCAGGSQCCLGGARRRSRSSSRCSRR